MVWIAQPIRGLKGEHDHPDGRTASRAGSTERERPEQACDRTKRTDGGDGTGDPEDKRGKCEGLGSQEKAAASRRRAGALANSLATVPRAPSGVPIWEPRDSLVKGQPGLPWQPPVQFSPGLANLILSFTPPPAHITASWGLRGHISGLPEGRVGYSEPWITELLEGLSSESFTAQGHQSPHAPFSPSSQE